ncbi:MAG: site-specific integrase [Hydrogenophaga sp.]|uniref:tyrosine-type recombinase/integrase n=1 Tax=Hydrogenophaga sp. TaxID=1904254 RepID=UPI0025BCEDD6|nr:tyrosine-type recombinase/integrase [Hydrogenophaga sp.]MCG2654116.1 site-specific integrase [Hydrogenophaga sp.]
MSTLLPTSPQTLSALLSLPASGQLNDDQALTGWLGFASIRNLQTYRSYKAESIRFRIFLLALHANSPDRNPDHILRDATETDVALYEAHLLGRYKSGEELAPLRVPTAILHRFGRKEQPFVTEVQSHGLITWSPRQLKPASVNQALSILHALYQYWMRPDPTTKVAYVGANPVKRVKSSSNRMQRQTARNFPIEALQAMFDCIEMRMELEVEDPQAQAYLARDRWVASLLFGLWGRRSEIARLAMKDFQHDGKRWTVRVARKGNKQQSLPVAPWVVQELMNYRESIGLKSLPLRSESRPAIARIRKTAEEIEAESRNDAEYTPPPINSDTIYRIVTDIARVTAEYLRSGSVLPDVDATTRELYASLLDEMSPHWFRHSGASIAINSGAMSMENASKMLGHSSTNVTAEMYYHPDEQQIEQGIARLGDQLRRSTKTKAEHEHEHDQ